jgi:hypothetical protein
MIRCVRGDGPSSSQKADPTILRGMSGKGISGVETGREILMVDKSDVEFNSLRAGKSCFLGAFSG